MRTDEQEIRQLVSRWMEATQAGDIDTVLSLMTDDIVFLVAGQQPMVGKAAYATAAKSQSSNSKSQNTQSPREAPKIEGKSEIQEITVAGDLAFMWTKLSVSVTPPGTTQAMKRAGHTLSVLRKESGRWLLARDANLLIPVAS